MSFFKTQIPVHIDRIKALLPKGSTVDRFEWDGENLLLYWHNGELQTKYTWPWAWTIEQLEQSVIPEGVTTPEHRKTAAERRKAEHEAALARATEEAQAQHIAETIAAKKRAEELAKAAQVRSEQEKLLTEKQSSRTNPKVEKMAGKTHRKRNPRNTTARSTAVDGTGPERVSGISQECNG